jgi:hypothetical protein
MCKTKCKSVASRFTKSFLSYLNLPSFKMCLRGKILLGNGPRGNENTGKRTISLYLSNIESMSQ